MPSETGAQLPLTSEAVRGYGLASAVPFGPHCKFCWHRGHSLAIHGPWTARDKLEKQQWPRTAQQPTKNIVFTGAKMTSLGENVAVLSL